MFKIHDGRVPSSKPVKLCWFEKEWPGNVMGKRDFGYHIIITLFPSQGRCSIINYSGHVIYDKFVCPREMITDFRTRWSGIRPSDMAKALSVDAAMKEINSCLAVSIF